MKRKMRYKVTIPRKPNYILPEQWENINAILRPENLWAKCLKYSPYRGLFDAFQYADENGNFRLFLIKQKHYVEYGAPQDRFPNLYYNPQRHTKCVECGVEIETSYFGCCISCFEKFSMSQKEGYRGYQIENLHGLKVGVEIEIDDPDLKYGEIDESNLEEIIDDEQREHCEMCSEYENCYNNSELYTCDECTEIAFQVRREYKKDGWGDIPQLTGWKNAYDGSLDYGRELKSPVMAPNKLLKELETLGAWADSRSLDTGCAGIHVNVNKKGYLSDLQVAKLRKLFYTMDEDLKYRLTGRYFTSWDTKPRVFENSRGAINDKKFAVEFRCFTAKHSTQWYKHCVNLTIEMCEYVRNTPFSVVSASDFIQKKYETYEN